MAADALIGVVAWFLSFTSVLAALFAHELIWHFVDKKRERDQLRLQREAIAEMTAPYRAKMN